MNKAKAAVSGRIAQGTAAKLFCQAALKPGRHSLAPQHFLLAERPRIPHLLLRATEGS